MDIQCTIQLSDKQLSEIAAAFGALSNPLPPPPTSLEWVGVTPHALPPAHTPVFSSLTEKTIHRIVGVHLIKYHHIIPVEALTAAITKSIMDEYGNAVEVISSWHDQPARKPKVIGRHGRKDGTRLHLDETVCRAVANHWDPSMGPFTKKDVARWLRADGYNPASAGPATAYLEGAGIVVAVQKNIEGRKSHLVYKWGRRMQDDEIIECHGRTGIDKVRKTLLLRRIS